MIFEYLLQIELLYENEKQKWRFLFGLHLVPTHERMIQHVHLHHSELIYAH